MGGECSEFCGIGILPVPAKQAKRLPHKTFGKLDWAMGKTLHKNQITPRGGQGRSWQVESSSIAMTTTSLYAILINLLFEIRIWLGGIKVAKLEVLNPAQLFRRISPDFFGQLTG